MAITREDNGWNASAAAWIASLGSDGDFSRVHVLDAPMLERATRGPVAHALDVGCGEGRFCRTLAGAGIRTTGIDITEPLVREARRRDPAGPYMSASAAHLPFRNAAFDLTVSYLTLCDIDPFEAAIAEMARVTAPGGRILVANLSPIVTANPHAHWVDTDRGTLFPVDNYLLPRREWVEWSGIRVRNWHRPFSAYMSAFLAEGLTLTHFAEPVPSGGDPSRAARYRRVPWFVIMEWMPPA